MNIRSRACIALVDGRWRRKLHKTFRRMKSVGRNVYIREDYSISPPENVSRNSTTWRMRSSGARMRRATA